jgi:hypothetical protein
MTAAMPLVADDPEDPVSAAPRGGDHDGDEGQEFDELGRFAADHLQLG